MVKLRKYRRRGVATGKWEVDVIVELPAGGKPYRERTLYRDSALRADARAWGEDRQQEVRALARRGLNLDQIRRALRGEVVQGPEEKPLPPTVAEFAPKFIEYAKANRHKASTIYAKESMLRVHLVPALGAKRLDQITEVDVQALKVRLAEYAPKTVNNVLSVLSKMLRVAKRLKVIPAVPVENFDLLKVPEAAVPPFYLRHTFSSHLAMRNAPARVMQELAGHRHITTTMRYMHLAQGQKEQAIRLLDQRPAPSEIDCRGGGVEAES